MRVIAHRGLWFDIKDQNSIQAHIHAVEQGFAIEIDVHSFNDKIVIAHDPPNADSPDFKELLEALRESQAFIAINIKQDGLALRVKELVDDFSSLSMVCFDMSTPQLDLYRQLGIPFFSRISDLEPSPLFFQEAVGLWMDSFSGEYPNTGIIQSYLNAGKLVALVSPELHKLNHVQLWNSLEGIWEHPNLLICTDFALKAKERWRK